MTRRVLLATPAMNFMVDAYYHNSCVEAVRLCARNGIDLEPLLLCGSSLIQDTRNQLVTAAYRGRYDDMVFVDADNSYSPEWLPKLLSYPVDCVGGVYRKKTDDAELYTIRIPGGLGSLHIDPEMRIFTAPGLSLGCGFLRLSRRAVVAVWEAGEKYIGFERKEPDSWIFDVRPIGGRLTGEDTVLSDRLAGLDIPTWADPTMTCGHFGAKNYRGDFLAYLRRRAAQQGASQATTA